MKHDYINTTLKLATVLAKLSKAYILLLHARSSLVR